MAHLLTKKPAANGEAYLRRMRTILLFSLLTLAGDHLIAQEMPPMSAQALPGGRNSEVTVRPIVHSALALTWNGHTVLVDPHDGAQRYTRFPGVELVLITDIHGDHLDTATLRGMDLTNARIVAPQAVVDQLPEGLKTLCTPLANGAESEVVGIGIEAVPMYNMPDLKDPRHPKGRGNGYVLTFGKERVYISGDTEDIPEMRALKNIDMAFVCMNLPYTMTVQQAASAVLAFKPKVVYPYHYRGKDGFSDVKLFKRMVNEADPAIDVQLMDWYAQ